MINNDSMDINLGSTHLELLNFVLDYLRKFKMSNEFYILKEIYCFISGATVGWYYQPCNILEIYLTKCFIKFYLYVILKNVLNKSF